MLLLGAISGAMIGPMLGISEREKRSSKFSDSVELTYHLQVQWGVWVPSSVVSCGAGCLRFNRNGEYSGVA